jgi:hypothetical protein
MKKAETIFYWHKQFPKIKKGNFATTWRSKNQFQAECIIQIKENTII